MISNKKVLLVEDQQVMAQLMSFELIAGGHQVTIADNGIEALSLLCSEDFDIVVTDLYMPEMGGLELIENIKQQQMTQPVIVLSASCQGDIAIKLNTLGVENIIDKPITDDKMVLLLFLLEQL